MVGQNVYTSEEIKFLLQRFIEGKDGPQVAEEYYEAFEKVLTPNQLRYVRNKYGKDPKYNTAMINTNMGKKRRRADDGTDRQNPSSSPDPKPKKQRKESEPKSQPANKKSIEALKSSPEPDNKGSRNSEPVQQTKKARNQSPMTLQAPVVTYQQLPASEAFMEMAQTLISPVAAPVANMASYQQQPGRIPADYCQIQTLWDNQGQNLGSFTGLGDIANAQTMQPSPAMPSVALAPSGGQHRTFVNNTPRIVQQTFPMASPYQVIPSPQPMNPPGQRMPAQHMPQYMMNQQSIDGMASIGQFSPLSLPLPAVPYYTTDPQESPHSDIQSPPCGPMSGSQAILPFGNQDWGSYLPSGLYNLPQQQRPDIDLSQFQPTLQAAPIEEETIVAAPVARSSGIDLKNKDASAEVPSNVALTTEAKPMENTTTKALHVVSSQVSGPDEAQKGYTGVPLTTDFDACQPPFLSDDDVDADPVADSDQIRDMITALFPHLQQVEEPEEHEIPETIDPKLLSDVYTQPALKRRASDSPSEGRHETAGDLAKSG